VKALRTPAIVLRRTNYGEADRILNFLTPDNGVVSAIARGVRREKSKLAGGIELFARCDINVQTGRGELAILTGARLERFYSHIMTDYDRLQFGYEAIKQVARAADSIDEPAFFALLDQAFAALDAPDIAIQFTQAWFWLQLAIILGVGMNLETDNHGMKLVEDIRYDYSQAEHAFVFHETGAFSSDHIKLLRILSAQAPKVAAQVKGAEDLIHECLWVAEQAVAH
jgi:DNA repair protein RecO (recombination protein O)